MVGGGGVFVGAKGVSVGVGGRGVSVGVGGKGVSVGAGPMGVHVGVGCGEIWASLTIDPDASTAMSMAPTRIANRSRRCTVSTPLLSLFTSLSRGTVELTVPCVVGLRRVPWVPHPVSEQHGRVRSLYTSWTLGRLPLYPENALLTTSLRVVIRASFNLVQRIGVGQSMTCALCP